MSKTISRHELEKSIDQLKKEILVIKDRIILLENSLNNLDNISNKGEEEKLAFWQDIQGKIKKEISNTEYNTWIKNLKAVKLGKNKLTLIAANHFIVEWVSIRYLSLIKKLVVEYMGENLEIIFLNKEEEISDLIFC